MTGSHQDRKYRCMHAPRLHLEPEEYLDLAFRVGFQPRNHNVLDALRRLSGVRADIVPEEFAASWSESSRLVRLEVRWDERTGYEELWNLHRSM